MVYSEGLSQYLPGETTQDSQFLGWKLNVGPPRYESKCCPLKLYIQIQDLLCRSWYIYNILQRPYITIWQRNYKSSQVSARAPSECNEQNNHLASVCGLYVLCHGLRCFFSLYSGGNHRIKAPSITSLCAHTGWFGPQK